MSRTTYRGTPKAGLYTRLSVDDGYVDRESNSITSQDGICQGDFHPKDESSLPAN